MKTITLTHNLETMVDDEDYNWLNQWKWHASRSRSGFYAARHSPRKHYKRYTILMHREILGLSQDDQRKGDHKNGNTLDNRRQNLRPVTHAENMQNAKTPRNNTSGLKGVHWHKQAQRWRVRIMVKRKLIHVGTFTNKDKAYAAYCEAVKLYHGEFGRLS